MKNTQLRNWHSRVNVYR